MLALYFFIVCSAKLIEPDEDGTYRVKVEKSKFSHFSILPLILVFQRYFELEI